MTAVKRSIRAWKRRLYESLGNPRYSRPSLNDLDRKLAAYLDFDDGFFIEAGANDGYQQSNTYYLERMRGWRGVLVEAIPELYERCKRERPNAAVYNCALVDGAFAEPTIEMHFAHLMSVAAGAMKSEDEMAHHIQSGLEIQRIDRSYTVQVPTRTLQSILDEQPQPLQIDFFSLDVEGFELNVLKGMNLDEYRPRYVLVEARYFDEVDAYLSGWYERVEQLSYHDYLYRAKGL